MSPSGPTDLPPLPGARFAGLLTAAKALQPKTVDLRRTLHRHPEQGLHLPKTQAAIERALDGLPLEITRGKSTTALTAVLRGARPGPSVLLRGDMDALPLTEDTGLDYASEVEGTMHACGHDTHVAMLASAAHLLAERKEDLAGSVVFMFQPGEEGYHGARHMIHEGVLDAAGEQVSAAFALHTYANAESGKILTRHGPILASADSFLVRVTGKGGHGSAPHQALDPVPAAAAMVGALQTMITRRISVFDPAVLSVTRISAGTTSNIIPETAELEGTIRTLSERTRALVRAELPKVCEGIGAAHGCRVMVDIEPGYPVTANDPAQADLVTSLAEEVLGVQYAQPMPEPVMGAEDFSYVLERVPGAMAFLGCKVADGGPLHSDLMKIDERVLETGTAMHVAVALELLGVGDSLV